MSWEELREHTSREVFDVEANVAGTHTKGVEWTWEGKWACGQGLCAVATAEQTKPYNVQVVQFWRGEEEPRRPYPLHWAIYIETSPVIGNMYQIAENSQNYAIDTRLTQPLGNPEDLRGSCIVGRVSRKELDEMETLLTRVAIVRHLPSWNSHDWVEGALEYLRCCCLFSIAGEIELSRLQDDMCWLLEDWPGIEDAVEFVSDANLVCVQNNRRFRDSHQTFWRLHETWRLKCAESERDEECDCERG